MCSFLFIQFAPILYGLAVLIGGFLIGGIIGLLSPSDATRIAIFGSRSSGKTTLWKQLKKMEAKTNNKNGNGARKPRRSKQKSSSENNDSRTD